MARRLKTVSDLRRYLADMINRVEDGQLNPATASRLGYLTNLLKGVIESSDIEERLAKLESQLKGEREKL